MEETGQGLIPNYILGGDLAYGGRGEGLDDRPPESRLFEHGVFVRAGDAPQAGAVDRERY